MKAMRWCPLSARKCAIARPPATLSERTELTAPLAGPAITRLNSTTGMAASAQRCASGEDSVVAASTMPSTWYCRISPTTASESGWSLTNSSTW